LEEVSTLVILRKRKAGRPPEYVLDDQDEPIIGLSAQPDYDKTGKRKGERFYLTGSSPREWMGRDREVAIQRFYARREKANREFTKLYIEPDQERSDRERENHRGFTWASSLGPFPEDTGVKAKPGSFLKNEWKQFLNLPSADLWAKVREMLLTDPATVAKRTGIPWIAWGPTLDAPQKLTLSILKRFRCSEPPSNYWERIKILARLIDSVGDCSLEGLATKTTPSSTSTKSGSWLKDSRRKLSMIDSVESERYFVKHGKFINPTVLKSTR
jgi:hypothetical protein